MDRSMHKPRYHGHLKGFFPLAVAAMLLWWRWRPFRVEVDGESMLPTLEPGEYLLAVRPGAIRAGSLVVVEHPDRPGYEIVKRMAAMQGEQVGGRVLGPDEYWVVGDNEEGSTDSRTFGPISAAAVRGRAVFRYWPLDKVRCLT
jgi:signal peptidase I